MQKRTDICILAMIIEKIEKTKLRNDGKLKNEPEPPKWRRRERWFSTFLMKRRSLYVVGKRTAERQKVDKRYEICYK